MNSKIDIEITIGLNQRAETVLLRLIDALQNQLSADDLKALSDLETSMKALLSKADTADGKTL